MNTQTPQNPEDDEDLKTFDIYHFFSRKDVIAMMLFIVVMLIYILYKVFSASAVV